MWFAQWNVKFEYLVGLFIVRILFWKSMMFAGSGYEALRGTEVHYHKHFGFVWKQFKYIEASIYM